MPLVAVREIRAGTWGMSLPEVWTGRSGVREPGSELAAAAVSGAGRLSARDSARRLRRRVDVLKVSAVRVDQSTLVREGALDPVKDRKRPT